MTESELREGTSSAKPTDEEFEVVIAVPEAREAEIGLPKCKVVELIDFLDSIGWDKRTLQRYINYALRLRKLEKERGRTLTTLIRDYEKLSREEVKTRYAIEQLLERRRKIEEDLKIYMEQYNVTLESIKRTTLILEELRKNGLSLEDLDRATRFLRQLKGQGYDVAKIVSQISQYDDLSKELEKMNRELSEARGSLQKLIEEREKLDELLKSDYSLVEGLKNLRNEVERLTFERETALSELSKYREEVDRLKKELEDLSNIKFDIVEVTRTLQGKRNELDILNEKVEELRRELSELIGVEASTKEIISKERELLEKLDILEKSIREKESYVELLDGEMAAAYSILKMLQDPEGGSVEELETLSQHLQKLIKVKKGEALAQKPLEPYFLERVRKALVDLIMPYLKRDFVPRWVFERVEKELKIQSERRIALEEEVASLRRSIEGRSRGEGSKPLEEERFEAQNILTAVSPDGVAEGLKTITEGKRARITCPYCKEATVVNLPSENELEEISSKEWRLRFKCGKCSKTYDIPADMILKKIRGE